MHKRIGFLKQVSAIFSDWSKNESLDLRANLRVLSRGAVLISYEWQNYKLS